MVASLLWKLIWCLLVPRKLVSKDEALRSVQLRGLWVLVRKCNAFSTIGTYLPPLGVTKGNSHRLHVL